MATKTTTKADSATEPERICCPNCGSYFRRERKTMGRPKSTDRVKLESLEPGKKLRVPVGPAADKLVNLTYKLRHEGLAIDITRTAKTVTFTRDA